jgi:hypothetical protein
LQNNINDGVGAGGIIIKGTLQNSANGSGAYVSRVTPMPYGYTGTGAQTVWVNSYTSGSRPWLYARRISRSEAPASRDLCPAAWCA